MTVTDAFLKRLDETASIQMTPDVLHQIKRCILDYVGVAFAGRRQLGDKLNAIESLGKDDGCSVIGTETKRDIYTAALMNGYAAHVLEFDDGHRVGAPHIEAVILSAMIGAAQKERLSFEQFTRGILIGYEATVRLSAAIQPGHKLKGFHSTGTCGTVGAACALAYSMNFTQAQKKGALSAAASGAGGLLQVLDDDSELKPYNVSHAILSGLTAALFGRAGFQGPEDVLGGKRGFLQAYTDQPDLERLIGESDRPAIFQIYVKPYPSCRHSHPAVECALRLCAREKIVPSEIERIEIQTYKLGIFSHDSTEISSISAAKMSTPYSVAAAIVTGACDLDAFSEECIGRDDIRQLTRRIRLIENERMTRACPARRGASVTIFCSDGSVFSEEVDNPLGEPEHNVSDAQLEDKYRSLMSFSGVPGARADLIRNQIRDLETCYGEFIQTI